MELDLCNLVLGGTTDDKYLRSKLINTKFETNWKKGRKNCEFCYKDLKHHTCSENDNVCFKVKLFRIKKNRLS